MTQAVQGLGDMRPWLIQQLAARATLHRSHSTILYNDEDAAIDELAAAELRKSLAEGDRP